MDFKACFQILNDRKAQGCESQHPVEEKDTMKIDPEMFKDFPKDELVSEIFKCHYERVQLYRMFQQEFVKHRATKTFASFSKFYSTVHIVCYR